MKALQIAKAIARLAALAAMTIALLLLVPFLAPFGGWPLLRRLWCRGGCLIVGLRWRVHGQGFSDCPTLFVANHVSYLDILLLGCVLDATFIAKSEVAGWPLLGGLARLARTMFIRRHWRDAANQRDRLLRRMAAAESFILFPEGTSGDGLQTLPFKTSLLSVAESRRMAAPVAIQPVTLAYARLRDGTPFGRDNAGCYAWFGDMALAPHLWALLKGQGIEVEIGFGTAQLSWSIACRKALGPALRQEIASQLTSLRCLAGGTETSATDLPILAQGQI